MKKIAIFYYGFRPFFLAAAFHAAVMIPLWIFLIHGDAGVLFGMNTLQWHMHEMLFGFLSAAIAGFVLTATPNWTGKPGWAGMPLAALTVLWLLGRLLSFPFWSVPLWISACTDLLFIPVLLGFILYSLASAKNVHNYYIALMLGLYWVADLLCWFDLLANTGTWERGIYLGFDTVLMLVIIIGGRVIPSFTTNYLKRMGTDPEIRMNSGLDKFAMLAVLALSILHQLPMPEAIIGVVALGASLLHFLRLKQWHSLRTRKDALVWILHVAYLWVPVALFLHAAQFIWHVQFASAWRHAFSVGVFSCMIMAIMSRAALGHTGRTLQAPTFMVAGYISLIAAGILRVFVAPLMNGSGYYIALTFSGVLWVAAFLVYLIIYAPILFFPRPDGKRG